MRATLPTVMHRRRSAWLSVVSAAAMMCFSLESVGDERAGEQKAQLCLLCHKDGPELRFTPYLEQQPADFLVAALMAFKTGQRKQPAMNVNAASLSQVDIRDIADYCASRTLASSNANLEPAKVAAGEKLVKDMQCANCHTATFGGAGTVPRLAGQKQPYLAWQLGAFRNGSRSHPEGMPVLKDREDVESVASYLASLR